MALTKIDDRGLKTPIDLLDNEKIRFGTGNDLDIFHDSGSTKSMINNQNGELRIVCDNAIRIGKRHDATIAYADNMIVANPDGSVELYYNNSLKFETTSIGVQTSGYLYLTEDGKEIRMGAGGDLRLWHNGTDSYIHNAGANAGNFYIQGAGADVDKWLIIQAKAGEDSIVCKRDAEVYLAYDGVKKLETTSTGVDIPDTLRLSADWADIGTQMCLGADAGGTGYIAVHTLKFNTGGNNSRTTTLELDASNNAIFAGTVTATKVTAFKASGQADLVIGSGSAGGAMLILDGDSNGDSSGQDYSYLQHDTAGNLYIVVDNPAANGTIYLKSNGGTYQAVSCRDTGVVELRYQNTKKFETINTGINVTGGIRLGGNNAANEIDDYETGTWTQTITNLGDHSKHGDSIATYTKVGDIVTATFFYKWTSRSTTNGAYGIKVSLPFSSASLVVAGVGSCACESIAVNSSDRTSFHTAVYSGVSEATFRASGHNTGEVSFNGSTSTSTSSGYFAGTVSYKAA